MPKSNVYGPRRDGVDVQTGTPILDPQDRRVSVGWSRDQYVQIGVGWVDPDVIRSSDSPLTVNSAGVAIFPDETDDKGRTWVAQWVDMDRHTINQLIRELRKARDAAFGRDE